MNNNKNIKQYLDYLDDESNIREDLINAVYKLKESPDFDIEIFYKNLNNIIINTSDTKTFQLVRMYPINKPYYLFGTFYYLLKDIVKEKSLEVDMEYLSKFVEYEIDLFMIVNYLKNK